MGEAGSITSRPHDHHPDGESDGLMAEDTRLCECGCGQPIPVAKVNYPKVGLIKGQQSPARFLRGHYWRVVRPPWWKGDDAGYLALHRYLRQHFPKVGACEGCGEPGKTEYALIRGRAYSRDRADYRELCKRCHNDYDEIGGSRWRGVITARQRAGDPPFCRCGCGGEVEWDASHSRWRSYVAGHYVGSARALRRKGQQD